MEPNSNQINPVESKPRSEGLRLPEEMTAQEHAREIGGRLANIVAMRQAAARGELNINDQKSAQ